MSKILTYYQIVEITPAERELDGEIVYQDEERVLLTYENKADAQKVLDCMESVNIGFDTFAIRERTITV